MKIVKKGQQPVKKNLWTVLSPPFVTSPKDFQSSPVYSFLVATPAGELKCLTFEELLREFNYVETS